MLSRARAGAVGVAVAVAGCAIHPLPEDLSGVSTYVIVRQIRCETRQSIINTALGWLTSEQNQGKVDPASRQIGLEFKNRRRPIQEFSPKLFKGRVGAIIAVFYDTGVAYTFDLDMSEINNFNTQFNLLKIFQNAKLTNGLPGGIDRTRQNERLFTITDLFGGLIRLPDDYCSDPATSRNYVVAENYVYPITGRIGVEKMIQDFVLLTLFGSLGGPKDNIQGPPTLVDQLSFTTQFSGSINPIIIFSPVGLGLSLSDASLNISAVRRDLHKVTIGLAIAGPGINLIGPLRTALFTTPLVSTYASTRGEQNAVTAVNQFLTLKLFQPTVVVTP